MDHESGSVVESVEAHDSLGPSLTPKQQMQVKGTTKSRMEQPIRNGTAVNGTALNGTTI